MHQVAQKIMSLVEVAGILALAYLTAVHPVPLFSAIVVAFFGLAGTWSRHLLAKSDRNFCEMTDHADYFRERVQEGIDLLDRRGTIADDIAHRIVELYPPGTCPIASVDVRLRSRGDDLVIESTAAVEVHS
jgi:hypothetical protein